MTTAKDGLDAILGILNANIKIANFKDGSSRQGLAEALAEYIQQERLKANQALLEELDALPNVYPEKIGRQYTHVEAIYRSAVTDRLAEINAALTPTAKKEARHE